MDKYSEIVSLGYICNVYAYLLQLNSKRQHTIFDNIASPMWAVYDLINTDFSQFMLPENMQKKHIFENNPTQFWVDTKNYIRFMFYSPDSRNRLQSQVDRLIASFNKTDGPVLFVRYQEPNTTSDGVRILDSQYTEKYAQTELFYLQQLSNLLKQKYPNLNFKILFMNPQPSFVDTDHNIVGLQAEVLDYKDRTISTKMANIFERNKAFLDLNL